MNNLVGIIGIFVLLGIAFLISNNRSKIDYKSVLYKSISRYSLETAGHLDLDAELKIWISGENQPAVSKKFNKKVNIYDVQKILASHVL